MKSNAEIEQAYVDGALDRITQGVHHKIARRRNRAIAIIAGAAVVVSGGSIAAALVWPNAQGSAYIACFQTDDPHSPAAEGVGFDMRDPIGYCIDSFSYRAKASDPLATWADKSRSDLMACRLADGVAGVFPATSDGCESIDLTNWTAADARVAAQIQTDYNQREETTFGIPIPPIGTTPHQILGQ